VPSHPRAGRFDPHIDFLGFLYYLWAAFHTIFGVAMALFAASAALLAVAPDGRPGLEVAASFTAAGFAILAATAVVWAIVHAWCGRALRRRDPRSRVLALALSLLNALLFPLGTVMAVYTLWLLLHEDVRARFDTDTSSPHPSPVS
jgi:MFS family permease